MLRVLRCTWRVPAVVAGGLLTLVAQAQVPGPGQAQGAGGGVTTPSPAANGSASAAAPAGAASGARRRSPLAWTLEIDAPKPLDELLRSYLDISRYQAQVSEAARKRAEAASTGAAQDTDDGPDADSSTTGATATSASPVPTQPPTSTPASASAQPPGTGVNITRSELRRLVAASPEQARALLEAEGYFASEIKVSLSDEVVGAPVVVKITVWPGPKATVEQVQLVFEGELDVQAEKGDRDAVSLVRKINQQWPLAVGKPFLQATWSAAKNATLATMRSEGYAAAVWSGTAATVDAETQKAKLFIVADSGPRFFYGPLTIEGLKRQPESAIRNTAGFRQGQPYREAEVLDFQERLQKLNLFESVFVTLNDDPAQAKEAGVTVQVREMPLQQATFGVGVSSDTGPRVSVEHLHRLLWGLPWQAKSKVQLGREESVLQTDLTSHPNAGRKRWLLSLQGSRQLDTDDALTLSYRARAGQSDEGDRLERLTYAEFLRAKVTSSDGLDLSDASALSGNQQLIWRDVDSQILPTRGFTANVQGSVGHTFSTMEEAGWFGRAYGRLTWYRPLPGQWYASLRAEGGHVFAADDVSVPDTLLFRAGGDESVRGYGYRTLGEQRNGVTVGARTMVTGSAELARPMWQRFPSLWGAVFIDAGDATDRWADLDPKLGYGMGVRWRSPVGPLRLDLAYGQEERQYRLHFSVGITL